MDAGNIWAATNFPMEGETKSHLYRVKVAQGAVDCIKQVLKNFSVPDYQPEPLDYSNPHIRGIWRNSLKQKQRSINWPQDTTEIIVRKIRSADSQPGLLDSFFGKAMYLYGAYPDNTLTVPSFLLEKLLLNEMELFVVVLLTERFGYQFLN